MGSGFMCTVVTNAFGIVFVAWNKNLEKSNLNKKGLILKMIVI
jgi:hypothetical protein